MSILQMLHDELVALENRMHDLVEPELVIGQKVREMVKALVLKVDELDERVESIFQPVASIGQPATMITSFDKDNMPVLTRAVAHQPGQQMGDTTTAVGNTTIAGQS